MKVLKYIVPFIYSLAWLNIPAQELSYKVAYSYPSNDVFHVVSTPLREFSELWGAEAVAATDVETMTEVWAGIGLVYTMPRRVTKLPADLQAIAGVVMRLDGQVSTVPVGFYLGVGFKL